MLVASDTNLPIPHVTIFNEDGDVIGKKGYLPWETSGYETVEQVRLRKSSGIYFLIIFPKYMYYSLRSITETPLK